MIHTAKQLKDKVKNMSGGNSEVLSYNLETLLAEKMQTILARGLANTRMKNFNICSNICKSAHIC